MKKEENEQQDHWIIGCQKDKEGKLQKKGVISSVTAQVYYVLSQQDINNNIDGNRNDIVN